ncbi:C-_U-editing enzyme APOBEC-1 isoform X2 [Ornithorhynchus anatinus]|uniref:C->U-editing enzyme APOBEC-1 isoform X2 n=1 Tax=Ornithorhynchus anatinus TaxID=9258 RepID=UPI0010A8CA77|nr:C->U-editing enzyme APOBEC-1 isoform X2 [Ornithorhynchus anatinus]
MAKERETLAADPTVRRRIKSWEFTSFFDPSQLRKETSLLSEVWWGSSSRLWRSCSQNSTHHVEQSFLDHFQAQRHLGPSTTCTITWFLSWSPCWECARAIRTFLDKYPTVKLTIYVARLYWHMDPQNRQGLRNLVKGGVDVRIMGPSEHYYCWRNFVDYSRGEEEEWPRYHRVPIHLFDLELHCICLDLPACLTISPVKHQQLLSFSLTLHTCHYQKLPPALLLLLGLVRPPPPQTSLSVAHRGRGPGTVNGGEWDPNNWGWFWVLR